MLKQWGTYRWFEERGADLIHPDDLDAFRKEASNSKVFECIDESQYLTLRYNDNSYRVKDELFTPVPSPKYTFGQNIKLKNQKEEAIITDIMWHSLNKVHYYFISVGSKKKTKRYIESDFIS